MPTRVLHEPSYIRDVVKYDLPSYSRDTDYLAAGSGKLALGTVLGKNAGDKYVPLDPAASTGEQIAAGVLLSAEDATGAEVKTIILKRHANVARQALVWPAGITDVQKATAISELEAIGIVARKEV